MEQHHPHKAIDFDERYAMLRYFNDNSSSLIEDLINYSKRRDASFMAEEKRLRTELHNAELDLKHATKSRRDLQEDLRISEATNEELQKSNDNLKNSNPYVSILIDGDGLLFKEEFIRQGIEGGKKAASALRAAIASVAKRNKNEQPENMEVVATVYANLAGLTGAMRRAGWLASPDQLREFTQGFTQTTALFDFIDVGYGKERADSKIRGATAWHLKNPNCKMVALGISHDSGYAPFIDELISVGQTRDRIVILEGSPTVPELQSTKVAIHRLTGTVFHNDKLTATATTAITERPATSVQRTAVAAEISSRRDSSSSSTATLLTPQSTPQAVASTTAPVASSSSPSLGATVTATTNGTGTGTGTASSSSYASTAKTTNTPKASPPPKLVFPPQTAKQLHLQQQREAAAAATAIAAKRQAQWNPGPRGLDPPITYSTAVVEAVRSRPHKLCNKYVLLGWCPKADGCPYLHPAKPTVDEVAALTYMSRVSPCTNGQECELDDCIYGHHCPSIQDGYCMHPYCRFDEDQHPPGTKFRTK